MSVFDCNGDTSMDVVLARRYVFLICFFVILSYASIGARDAFAQEVNNRLEKAEREINDLWDGMDYLSNPYGD
jgi:hypothetical protein